MPMPDGPRDPRHASRRELLAGTALAAGALATLPFLSGTATASGRSLIEPGGATKPRPRRDAAPLTAGPVDDFIRAKMKVAHVPSLTAAVVKNDNLTWTRGYGRANREMDIAADPDTVYMLASISKTIICAALMQLWEAGSIDLDADVNDYLPFPIRNPAFPGKKITARNVLTHTSGIRDRYSLWGTMTNPTPQGYCVGDPVISLYDILQGYLEPGGAYYVADKNFYDSKPGQTYHYSNIGADVAALLVQEISGTDFNTFCIDNIFTPLGMVETGYHLSDISTPNLAVPYQYRLATKEYDPYPQYGYPDYPCGCLRTSVTHLSRWLRCFMNDGELEGTRILEKATVKEIRRPQIPGVWWQGLIWYYRNNRGNVLLGHGGSDYGVATSMFYEAKGTKGAIYLANRYVYGWKAWYGLRDIESRLFSL